jgi:two-component system alkaline phosphatase synthesis response regulator PhoP
MQLLLEHEGYQTRWCEDETLYGVIREWQPDLILMDLRMPRLDGIEATQTIKSDPSMSAIPVIIVTAEQVTADGLASIRANELVPKPFRVAQLLERIRYWISQHTGSRTAGPAIQGGLSHAG